MQGLAGLLRRAGVAAGDRAREAREGDGAGERIVGGCGVEGDRPIALDDRGVVLRAQRSGIGRRHVDDKAIDRVTEGLAHLVAGRTLLGNGLLQAGTRLHHDDVVLGGGGSGAAGRYAKAGASDRQDGEEAERVVGGATTQGVNLAQMISGLRGDSVKAMLCVYEDARGANF